MSNRYIDHLWMCLTKYSVALSNSVSAQSSGWLVQFMKLCLKVRRGACEKDTRDSAQAQIPTKTRDQI